MAEEKIVGSFEGLEKLSSEDFVSAMMTEPKPASTETPPATLQVPILGDTPPVGEVLSTMPLVEEKPPITAELNDDGTPKVVTPLAETTPPATPPIVDANGKPIVAEEAPVVIEFKTPEEKLGTISEGEGWTDLAKDIGFEIAEDTHEAYKASLETFYKEKYKSDIGKYSPEAQTLIEFLDADGKLEDFAHPTKELNGYLALDNVDLISEDLKAQGMTDELIEKKITKMTENDEIDLAAFAIRKDIKDAIKNVEAKVIQDKLAATKRTDNYKILTAAQELADIKTSFNTVNEFMEIPLTSKIKDYIIKNWEDGKYADVLNTPAMKVQALLLHELGKDGVALLKTKVMEEAKLARKVDRHAIPPVVNAGGAGQVKDASPATTTAEGNWAALGTPEDFRNNAFGQS